MSAPLIVVSSDGHAGALMKDYRPYLDPEYREAFDGFLVEWDERGSRNFDPPALRRRLDPEYVEEWIEKLVDTDRIDGFPDPHRRLEEMAREGVSAEILFPDFGLPFELYSRSLASALGHPALDEPHKRAGMRAFNRWLVDFMSVAPARFVGMATVNWQYDLDEALAEIRWAHDAGMKGIVLPEFDPEVPLYHPRWEPIWTLIEELGLVVNSHSGLSSTTNRVTYTPEVPHPACAYRLFLPEVVFFTHLIFPHLVWGGVLERHPGIKVVFTEQGSSWILAMLEDMDYSYDGSYFRTDYKDVIPRRPSEYFARQCYLGSSLFSRAEVEARHRFGLDKMMLGMDFPHHEGTLLETTQEYLKATLGAAHVPEPEARKLLGLNAVECFDLDVDALTTVAAQVATMPADVLAEPEVDLFPRGDVHKPLNAY